MRIGNRVVITRIDNWVVNGANNRIDYRARWLDGGRIAQRGEKSQRKLSLCNCCASPSAMAGAEELIITVTAAPVRTILFIEFNIIFDLLSRLLFPLLRLRGKY